MHVLHLPPRHLLRITALAALLAVALTAIIVLAASRLSPGDRSSPTAPSSAGPATVLAAPAAHVRVPLAPPTVFDQPLTDPVLALDPAAAAR